MKKVKSFFKNLWNDESAQGATEYILLIVVVVALVIMFKDRIKGLVGGKLEEIGGGFDQINTSN
jgi:Flp pilus assembly pilin Flp